MRRAIATIGTISAVLVIACAEQVAVLDRDGGGGMDASQQDAPNIDAPMDSGGGDGGKLFCTPTGGACGAWSECCSNECVDGYCFDPPQKCSVNGAKCSGNGDCCSNVCSGGTCAAGCREGSLSCTGQGLQSDCCGGLACGINGCQPYPGPPPGFCKDVGAMCMNNQDCCTHECDNGKCALKTCSSHGAACTKWIDCCSGACDNGACIDHPPCKWSGSCMGGGDCCSGKCNAQQCQIPIVILNCPHLVWLGGGINNVTQAPCFDCMSDNCCTQKSNSIGMWQQCINDCMSDDPDHAMSTWDAYHACLAKCGPSGSGVEACMTDNCSAKCPN